LDILDLFEIDTAGGAAPQPRNAIENAQSVNVVVGFKLGGGYLVHLKTVYHAITE
jgi:hypothetical protein